MPKLISSQGRHVIKGYVYGHGVNDADYPVSPRIGSKRKSCHIYDTWKHMLRRVFVDETPTYAQCTIDPDWLFFSVFREWMLQQGDVSGLELDKDIRLPGNKHYAPDTCCFATRAQNALVTQHRNNQFKQGVVRDKGRRRYSACIYHGSSKYLGSFDTIEEAHQAYRGAKNELLLHAAKVCTNPVVAAGLILHTRRKA